MPKLAKPCLDVGVMTGRAKPLLAFWQNEVGLAFEETLPVRRGHLQHRHTLNGSVFKLNEIEAGVPSAPPCGLRRLDVAREGLGAPRELTDPDGTRVRLVPPGHEGVSGVAVELAVRDLASAHAFYGGALGLERTGGADYACGHSRLRLREEPGAIADAPILGPGLRYLTIQVFDCEAEHRGVLERGGREGAPPRRAGDVAVFSMVRDPDGNWIELSQRASLTGSLEPGG